MAAADAAGSTNYPQIVLQEVSDVPSVVISYGATQIFAFQGVGILTLAKQSACRAYLSSDQTIGTGVWTKVELDLENFDVQSEFVSYKFTATVAGKYLIIVHGEILELDLVESFQIAIYKNGAIYTGVKIYSGGPNQTPKCTHSDILSLAVDDYIEMYVYHNHGANLDINSGVDTTFMAISKIA